MAMLCDGQRRRETHLKVFQRSSGLPRSAALERNGTVVEGHRVSTRRKITAMGRRSDHGSFSFGRDGEDRSSATLCQLY